MRGSSDRALGSFLRYLWPVVVGLIGIAILTTVDLLVVRARFPDDAGPYAAASAFARVAFFLPATILTVLFPRTAARQARGEDTADILGRSLIATAIFGGALAAFYWMTGARAHSHELRRRLRAGRRSLLLTHRRDEPLRARERAGRLSSISRRAALRLHRRGGSTRPDSGPGARSREPEGVLWMNIAIGVALLDAQAGRRTEPPRPSRRCSHACGGVSVRRRAVREAVYVLVGATVLVCVLFRPIASTRLDDRRPARTRRGVWWLWRVLHEGGYHLLGTAHHALTGAPFGWSEANGLNLQWLLPYYPTYLVAKIVGEVAAYNLALLTGYVLSGAAMYALTRYLGCGRLVSAWAGMVYIVFPWHLARTPHPSLVHLELLPSCCSPSSRRRIADTACGLRSSAQPLSGAGSPRGTSGRWR